MRRGEGATVRVRECEPAGVRPAGCDQKLSGGLWEQVVSHNEAMSSLESRIDELYQGSLDSFTAARNALAKSLTGDAKKQVSALPKPLAIPWIVNQTYWHAREAYDALLAAGKKLRAAQIGALQGRSPDIRAASDRHAEALIEAMSEATRLAKAGGVQPQTDALRRMFEAVSTRASLPAEHGRFAKPIEPAGFEGLTGLSIVASPRRIEDPSGKAATKKDQIGKRAAVPSAAAIKATEREERRLERERAEAARRRKAAIEKAEADVTEAVQAENRARFEWERTKKKVEAANRALTELQSSED